MSSGGKNTFTSGRCLQPEGIGSLIASRDSFIAKGLGVIVRTVETESVAELAKRPSGAIVSLNLAVVACRICTFRGGSILVQSPPGVQVVITGYDKRGD